MKEELSKKGFQYQYYLNLIKTRKRKQRDSDQLKYFRKYYRAVGFNLNYH